MKKTKSIHCGVVVMACFTSSCIPKFREPQGDWQQPRAQEGISQPKDAASPASLPPSPVQVGKNAFKIPADQRQVWDAALSVLLQNYNINIIDGHSGVITTEWDSFFLNGSLYRNKLTLRIVQTPYNQSTLTILNNVETLDLGQNGTTSEKTRNWVPSEDQGDEQNRIVNTIASLLRLGTARHPIDSVARKSRLVPNISRTAQ